MSPPIDEEYNDCEIIGDLVHYLVPRVLVPSRLLTHAYGISIQVSSYRTVVLTYMLAIGFKTPTRGFSRFTRNLK